MDLVAEPGRQSVPAHRTTTHPSAATKRRIHPLARWSLLLIAISLVLPLTMLAPAIASVPLCWAVAVILGVETLIKYRWPGRTATELARRPTVRDVWFATAGIVIGLSLLALLIFSAVMFA